MFVAWPVWRHTSLLSLRRYQISTALRLRHMCDCVYTTCLALHLTTRRPGFEPATCWSQVQLHPITTRPLSHKSLSCAYSCRISAEDVETFFSKGHNPSPEPRPVDTPPTSHAFAFSPLIPLSISFNLFRHLLRSGVKVVMFWTEKKQKFILTWT